MKKSSIEPDLKTLISLPSSPTRSNAFVYAFVFVFIGCTTFIAFSPSNDLFASSSASLNSLFSHFLPGTPLPDDKASVFGSGEGRFGDLGSKGGILGTANLTGSVLPAKGGDGGSKDGILGSGSSENRTVTPLPENSPETPLPEGVGANGGDGSSKDEILGSGVQTNGSRDEPAKEAILGSGVQGNVSGVTEDGSGVLGWIEEMVECDIFHGHWVKDDMYPLYADGSCPHIDEQFNCHLNGRPDRDYQKLRWKPDGCNIPRLNATDMLERLRGKRLVFVGDSLNRNMWESLVCILRNSITDKTKVFEASGRSEYRKLGAYSFVFKDYNATVEFFTSPFLVQEWEMHNGNATKETLRLDIIEKSSSKYKNANVIIFNTGHWWTHEKTSKGKDYYQEGNRVYSELNVDEAFHKALNTWAKWVDANVNPKESLVFFRGYSASHFSGGQWNSGGACDKETEPIKNETYLSKYPLKMNILESVLKEMKTPVSYLNITRMTDYRKEAHPSIYRKQKSTEEERKNPERFQDCSHWCLPGVPDSWNEILYAQLIIKQYKIDRTQV